MSRTITEPLRSPTDESSSTAPPPPLQPPGHSTSRWAGAAEFLIGSTLATLVGVLWVEAGSAPKDIVFVNIVSCMEGLKALQEAYPEVRVVTSAVDPILNEKKYIVPGLGDFGDRYFGTDGMP